jgi:phosphoesterase RecJ-like protein
MSMINIQETVDFLLNNDNFTVLCHVNPDGDTLGSGYALCGALHRIEKRARLLCDDKPSPRFDFLLETLDDNPHLRNFPFDTEETIITVDVADLELLGSLKDRYPKIDLSIDHHMSNKNYAERTLLDTRAAACAEVVWELIMELEERLQSEQLATPAIAAAIYTGISTDTGCFKYSNTSTISHMFAAEVMGYGFDVDKINYVMFEMKTRERVLLEQQALSSIEYYFSGKCAVIVLTAEMLDGIDPEDAGNVSSLPKQIEGVHAGVVIKEKSAASSEEGGRGVFKVSVRTSEEVNAQSVCSVLGGGGHLRAAGCTLTGDADSVKATVLHEISKQLG